MIMFGGSLHHSDIHWLHSIGILIPNICKDYLLFLSMETSFQYRYWDPGERTWGSGGRSDSPVSYLLQRWDLCKKKYEQLNGSAMLPVWVIHVWSLTRLWKSKFMHKFMLCGFREFYQLSKYYRAMINLKCEWWLSSSEIVKKSFNICWVIIGGDTGTSWIKKKVSLYIVIRSTCP